MPKAIVTTTADGIQITTPSPAFVEKHGGEDAAIEALRLRFDGEVIDAAAIPADRDFRDAWKLDGKSVAVDMDKARNIQRDRLRVERAPLLASLDVEYIRADEAGEDSRKAEIVAEKQRLRDVTKDPRIDAAVTPEELKTIKAKGRS